MTSALAAEGLGPCNRIEAYTGECKAQDDGEWFAARAAAEDQAHEKAKAFGWESRITRVELPRERGDFAIPLRRKREVSRG